MAGTVQLRKNAAGSHIEIEDVIVNRPGLNTSIDLAGFMLFRSAAAGKIMRAQVQLVALMLSLYSKVTYL
jgi:hypothetical protein